MVNEGENPDAEAYDARKRDPQYAHASSSPLWELVSHFYLSSPDVGTEDPITDTVAPPLPPRSLVTRPSTPRLPTTDCQRRPLTKHPIPFPRPIRV
jgi:hypothetical protein